MEERLIGKVAITKKEVETAVEFLYNQYGKDILTWTPEKQDEEISNYWMKRGKKDLSFLNKINYGK